LEGSLAVSGEASVSINNLNSSNALAEPDALEDLLDVNGDPGPEPILPSHVATYLGEQLQAFYSHLISEPVPDRFVRLLDQLDRQRNGHDGE
jgi:Anti-sigma factor NepR